MCILIILTYSAVLLGKFLFHSLSTYLNISWEFIMAASRDN